MFVEKYIAEFESLMLKCELVKLEKNTVAHYLEGLRPFINNVLQLQLYCSLIDVQTLHLKVEKQHALRPPPPFN